MDVIHEKTIAVFVRPIIPQVNHQSGMCMTSSSRVGKTIAGMWALVPRPVKMVSDCFNIVINKRIHKPGTLGWKISANTLGLCLVDAVMLSPLSLIPGSLDDMPEMRHHAGLNEALALLVKIDPPGIAG